MAAWCRLDVGALPAREFASSLVLRDLIDAIDLLIRQCGVEFAGEIKANERLF